MYNWTCGGGGPCGSISFKYVNSKSLQVNNWNSIYSAVLQFVDFCVLKQDWWTKKQKVIKRDSWDKSGNATSSGEQTKHKRELTFTVPWTGENTFGCTGWDISWACKSPISDSWIALYVSDLAGSYCTVFLFLGVGSEKRGKVSRGKMLVKEMCEEEYK